MTLCRLYILGLLVLVGHTAISQQDSLALYAKRLKLGTRSSLVDSLMTFSLAKMHNASGGTWRYIYDNIYQSTTTYQDKNWNGYTFRKLYDNDRLIYIDLVKDATLEILYYKADSITINQTIDKFNEQLDTKDSFRTVLKSFYTKVFDLDRPLQNFFSNASVKNKNTLLKYAKSLCPEYSASAVIKMLEMEKSRPFLNSNEKLLLRKIVLLDRQIQFMVGDMYRLATFSDFLKEYMPNLQSVLK